MFWLRSCGSSLTVDLRRHWLQRERDYVVRRWLPNKAPPRTARPLLSICRGEQVVRPPLGGEAWAKGSAVIRRAKVTDSRRSPELLAVAYGHQRSNSHG